MCRVLDPERRLDLKDAYYNLVVTKEGRPVSVPRAVSDPGPVSDADCLEIPPGDTKPFLLSKFPDEFETLPQPEPMRPTLSFGATPTRATPRRTHQDARSLLSRSESANRSLQRTLASARVGYLRR